MPLDKYQWEITGETKWIGDFLVRRAIANYTVKAPIKTLKDQTRTLEAWFTQKIPVPYGPIDVAGLPGLVLETTNGNVSFKATKINLHPQINRDIAPPTAGKHIKKKI